MAALHSGRRLVFARSALYGEDMPVRIMVEPVRFGSALDDYHRCQANLLPVNYDQVARTALYFELAQDELTDQEVRKLDELSLYAQTDKNVTRIFKIGRASCRERG